MTGKLVASYTPQLNLGMASDEAVPTAHQGPAAEQAYQDQQLEQLKQQALPYEEYQKRYRQIMEEK